jgi:hypothetical protein
LARGPIRGIAGASVRSTYRQRGLVHVVPRRRSYQPHVDGHRLVFPAKLREENTKQGRTRADDMAYEVYLARQICTVRQRHALEQSRGDELACCQFFGLSWF